MYMCLSCSHIFAVIQYGESALLLYTFNLLWFSLITELLQVRQKLNDHMKGGIHEQQTKLKSVKLVYSIP